MLGSMRLLDRLISRAGPKVNCTSHKTLYRPYISVLALGAIDVDMVTIADRL